MLDCIVADASIPFRVPRSRAHDQLCGVFLDELFQGDLVIAEDSDCSAFQHEVLVDVPSERVVVIYEYEVRGGRNGRRGRRVVRGVIDESQSGSHGCSL